MRVVADSHALVWYAQGSSRLSPAAAETLRDAEHTEGVVVSAATMIDLWYVTQTTGGVNQALLTELRHLVVSSHGVSLHPVDLAVTDEYRSIARETMRDPWDRLIVATAVALRLPLVTKDGLITASGLVETIW